MCATQNPFYDPNKPTRLKQAATESITRKVKSELRETIKKEVESELRESIKIEVESELRETIKREVEAELTDSITRKVKLELQVDNEQVEYLSQSCVDDGNFSDTGSDNGENLFTSTPKKDNVGSQLTDQGEESASGNGEDETGTHDNN